MSTAAGPACWSTSNAKPRPQTHRHWAASTTVQTATEITKGASHEHRTLCLPAEPARVQGDGGGEPSRARMDTAPARPAEGRAHDAAIRRAQSQHAHAHTQGWRLRAVGVERDLPVPCIEETRERPAAQGRARPLRRDALAVLGPRALGPGLRGLRLRIRG